MPDKRFFSREGPFKVKEIFSLLGEELPKKIDGNSLLEDITDIDKVSQNKVFFFSGNKNNFPAINNKYGLCITSHNLIHLLPNSGLNLAVKNPLLEFSKVANLFYPNVRATSNNNKINKSFINKSAKISSSACIQPGVFIGDKAVIGDNVFIESNVTIGQGVCIGNNSQIGSNSSISFSHIGNDVVIDSGCRIGQEGFGFIFDEVNNRHSRVPQLGIVIINNDVTIGANTTIDRGFLKDTFIDEGCRIDNQVQIGHNVTLGKRCIVISQVGISGSCKIGNDVVLAGQVGVADHVNIDSNARIAAKSGIMSNVNKGEVVMGYPAKPIRSFWREVSFISKSIKKKNK